VKYKVKKKCGACLEEKEEGKIDDFRLEG